jgi:hypothetical protein
MATFYQRKRNRNQALAFLPLFVAIGVASAIVMWVGAPEDRRVFAAGFMAMFWGGWVCLSAWVLLAYWRERLDIERGIVTQQSVVSTRKLSLPAVTEAYWKIGQNGRIVLRSVAGRLTIRLGNFERVERLWIIRYFRGNLPESAQRDWALFCHKIALPLRDHDTLLNREPAHDEVKITRQRRDRYSMPFIALATAVGVVLYWRRGELRFLAAPTLPVFLWLLLRFATPKQGFVSKRLGAEPPGMKRFLWFELVWLAVGLGGIALFNFVKPPKQVGLTLGIVGVLFWFGVQLWRGVIEDRNRLRQDLERGDEAMRRWQESESAGAAGAAG